jgi:SAM-dependent methyltransferase
MNGESILTGLVDDECVEPGAAAQLLVELSCDSEELCCAVVSALEALPCQVEWQAAEAGFCSYVLAEHGADHDLLLGAVARLLDQWPEQCRLRETRLVQGRQGSVARHGFCFVEKMGGGNRDIVLAAGSHAFGSGHHPSTALVVELLEEFPVMPSPVLDVGCGTGVLSLVAGRLGAGRVVGVDIDQEAVRVAVANARANELAHKLCFTTTPLSEVAGPFALVVANLTASVLYRLLDEITAKAGPGGVLIISGLQGRQGNEATAWAAERGWQLAKSRTHGKWQARQLVRNECRR